MPQFDYILFSFVIFAMIQRILEAVNPEAVQCIVQALVILCEIIINTGLVFPIFQLNTVFSI